MNGANVFAALQGFWPLQTEDGQVPQILIPQTNPLLIPPSSNLSSTIELSGDCYLQVDDWVFWSSDAAYPNVAGFRVSVYWGSREWSLMNAAVRGELVFGTAQRPGHIGYRPWALSRPGGGRAILTFDFSNLGAATCTVEIALRGHRSRNAPQLPGWVDMPRAGQRQLQQPQAGGQRGR